MTIAASDEMKLSITVVSGWCQYCGCGARKPRQSDEVKLATSSVRPAMRIGASTLKKSAE